MPITFTSKIEAEEYRKRMLNEEKVETYIVQKGDKFLVHTLGKISDRQVVFERVPKDWLGPGNIGEFGDEGLYGGEYEGKATAWYKPHAGTRTRLHELGHTKLGHMNLEPEKIHQTANDEIDAEIYSYNKTNKPITYKVGLIAYRVLTEDRKVSEEEANKIVKEVLISKGIELPDRDKLYYNE